MSKGFTLVELSVVLVIIGLLAGGIMVGKDLIRGAELQSVLTDVGKFRAAVSVFESRYNAMPGDLTTAQTYWGASVTTNGNGNGIIDYNNGLLINSEEYLAWQHLALAGLMPGSTATYNNTTAGLPKSQLNNGYYRMSYQKGTLVSGTTYTGVYGRYGHMISINMMNTTSGQANTAILSGKDVMSLDQKADDGFAPTGDIMGFNPSTGPGCVNNDYTVVGGPWYYNTPPNDNIACKIFFMLPEQ